MLRSSKTLRKALLGTAAVAFVGAAGSMSVSSDADAAAYAYSSMNVTDMLVTTTDSSGNVSNGAGTGFFSFSFTSTKLTASLDANAVSTSDAGIVGTDIGDAFDTGGNTDVTVAANGNASTGNVDTSGSFMDMNQLCLGDCGSFTNNNNYTAPAFDNTVNFAVADSHMTDTVLNGGDNPIGTGFGVQAGASVNGGSSSGVGNSAATNFMNWNFFAGENDALLTLNWNELRNLFVQKEFADEFATAFMSFTITLKDLTADTNAVTLFSLITDQDGATDGFPISVFNNTQPTLVENENDLSETTFGLNESVNRTVSGTLIANHEYNLVFTFVANAEVTSPAIPEPGTLSLLGAGLLGLGVVAARRRKKAQTA